MLQMLKAYKNIDLRVMAVTTLPFTLLAAVAIVDDPFTWRQFGWKIVESFTSIVLLWFMVKIVVKKMRRALPEHRHMHLRLAVQLILSMIAAIGLFMLIGMREHLMEYHALGQSYWDCVFRLKEVVLVMIVFSSLINMVYESFYLFDKLAASQVDAEKYKKESLEAQFQNLKSQVNPHFLFNSFNTLSTLIEENADKAQEFVHELSDVYRYVLNSREKNWVQLSTELEFVNSFYFLLKMRFEDHLHLVTHIDDKYKNYYIPPVSLQLLIENAIKHNEISSAHQLKIHLHTEGDTLVISNNKKLKKNVESSTGIGLKNIKDRYEFLSGKTVEIENTDESFVVRLPLLKMAEQ